MNNNKKELKITIGLDIDETITANPAYYAELCRTTYANGGKVFVITSRSEIKEARSFTEAQLKAWSIRYERLYMFKPFEEVKHLCPYDDLDWYKKILWQKVYYCIKENITQYYDDDDKVIELFKSHAKDIAIVDAKSVVVTNPL